MNKEFKFTVTVEVDAESVPAGIEVNADSVARMVQDALDFYTDELCEDVLAAEEWKNDSQAIAGTRPLIRVQQ